MADNSYSPKVYLRQGGDGLVIASGGVIKVESGGKIVPNSGTQAAAVTAVATTTIAWTTAEKGRVNSLITALTNIGVLATS